MISIYPNIDNLVLKPWSEMICVTVIRICSMVSGVRFQVSAQLLNVEV
jgi:hypothetical protein